MEALRRQEQRAAHRERVVQMLKDREDKVQAETQDQLKKLK